MAILAAFILAVQLGAPQPKPAAAHDSVVHHTQKKHMTITEVLKKHTERWMQIEGVIGTGEGKTKEGKPCITVFVDTLTAAIRKQIPATVDGFTVRFEESGQVTAFPKQ